MIRLYTRRLSIIPPPIIVPWSGSCRARQGQAAQGSLFWMCIRRLYCRYINFFFSWSADSECPGSFMATLSLFSGSCPFISLCFGFTCVVPNVPACKRIQLSLHSYALSALDFIQCPLHLQSFILLYCDCDNNLSSNRSLRVWHHPAQHTGTSEHVPNPLFFEVFFSAKH